jgi:hypothetical protein
MTHSPLLVKRETHSLYYFSLEIQFRPRSRMNIKHQRNINNNNNNSSNNRYRIVQLGKPQKYRYYYVFDDRGAACRATDTLLVAAFPRHPNLPTIQQYVPRYSRYTSTDLCGSDTNHQFLSF